GGHHQVGEEGAVLLHLDRTHRDLRVAPHEVEQADPQVPGEAVVDDLERRHAAAHDALLKREVVGNDAFGRVGFVGGRLLAADTDEEGVDFVLGQELFGHRGDPRRRLLDDELREVHGGDRAGIDVVEAADLPGGAFGRTRWRFVGEHGPGGDRDVDRELL